MAKILIATEKPYAAAAVNGIREVIESSGMEMVLLEKYTEKAELLKAVADVEGLIIRSDKIDNERRRRLRQCRPRRCHSPWRSG